MMTCGIWKYIRVEILTQLKYYPVTKNDKLKYQCMYILLDLNMENITEKLYSCIEHVENVNI